MNIKDFNMIMEHYQISENIADHARRELKLVGLFDKDSDYNGMIGKAVMELMRVFAKQGHSGFSAAWVRELFNKLSNYETLTPITDNPEDWMCVSDKVPKNKFKGYKGVWQSKRNPAVFSYDGGKTYYHLDNALNKGKRCLMRHPQNQKLRIFKSESYKDMLKQRMMHEMKYLAGIDENHFSLQEYMELCKKYSVNDIFNEMKYLAGINEDIFEPATKDEIKQRRSNYEQVMINELIARDDCIKHEDGSYSFKKSVVFVNMIMKKLPIKFKKIYGNFNCSNCQLETLENAPEYVGGNFDCSFNNLTSLEGGPEYVGKGFWCNDNKLISLKDAPKHVGGYFDCSHNKLTSLQGAPEYIGNSFACGDNNLISLKGCPKYVGGYFDCRYNKVKITEKEIRKICDVKGRIYV